MLLTIDIGNSRVGAIVFHGDQIVERLDAPTQAQNKSSCFLFLSQLKSIQMIRKIMVSSVVPNLDKPLRTFCMKSIKLEPKLLDHTCAPGLKFSIDQPSKLGADRIAVCLGALTLEKPPLIIIDFGTATNIEIIDGRGVYLGGAIFPGARLAIDSLAQNTAKLKNILFLPPKQLVGVNTQENIRVGVYHQILGGTERLIRLYRQELGLQANVFATGGMAPLFAGVIDGIDRFEPDLIHLGLKWAANQ